MAEFRAQGPRNSGKQADTASSKAFLKFGSKALKKLNRGVHSSSMGGAGSLLPCPGDMARRLSPSWGTQVLQRPLLNRHRARLPIAGVFHTETKIKNETSEKKQHWDFLRPPEPAIHTPEGAAPPRQPWLRCLQARPSRPLLLCSLRGVFRPELDNKSLGRKGKLLSLTSQSQNAGETQQKLADFFLSFYV